MTQLVPRNEVSSLDVMPQSWALAERIARTDFVPTALRGKPEAVLAAILTGHELGIGPMQSLSKIHVIEGRPSMAAELMRALVLAAGHELWVEESNDTRCTLVARRAGGDRESRFTWTKDDAKKAGLDGKQNWRKYPRAMLLARASSEAVRAVFPDVVAGVSYSTEELTDGDVFDPDDVAAARQPAAPAAPAAAPKRARAGRAATAAPAQRAVEAADADTGELPPLPDEEDPGSPAGAGTGEGEGSGPVAAVADPSSPPDDEASAKSRAQQVAMWCNDAGLDDDGRHRFLAAFSFGQYSSAKAVPPEDLAELRAQLVRLRRDELRLVDDKLVEVGASSDPMADDVLDVASSTSDWSSMKVSELADACRERGLVPAGNKAELVAMLEAATA